MEHFVTKFGMVMQHQEPECHAGILCVCVCVCVCVLFSKSSSQRGLTWAKYGSFYYIFWTVDSLAFKLGLMIHHHKPECPVKNIRLLPSGSRSQWRVKMLVFVQMIFSKPPNILFPNLVLWCIIMSRRVMQKDWFAIFKVKVTASAHMIKIWQFLLYLLNCWSFCYQTWFNSNNHKPMCFMKKLDCYVQGQGHRKIKTVSESLSRWYLLN